MTTASSPRVLVIDDEERVRGALARLFRRNGIDPSTAVGAERALARLERGEHFDCLLVDLIMPGMRGKEFIEILRREELFPLERVIVLTAVHHADNATAYMQYGVAGYCGKPWESERLVDQVRRVCGTRPESDQLRALV